MKSTNLIFLTFTIMVIASLSANHLQAQALSRSSGMGLRLGFHIPENNFLTFNVSGYSEDAQLKLDEFGAWAFYYSRLNKNWFVDLHLGVLFTDQKYYDFQGNTFIDPSPIIPLLVGLRYEIFTSKLPGNMQPYLAIGIGPYWLPSLNVRDRSSKVKLQKESAVDLGAYLGIGANIQVNDWLILNVDLKNHYYNFENRNVEDLNAVELGLGATFTWGRERPIFEIVRTQLITEDIYPAYYQYYNSFPLALITVKNMTNYPIEVNAKCSVPPYSQRPKESGYYKIRPGQQVDIPLTAYFSSSLKNVAQGESAIMEIEVSGRAGDVFTKATNTQLMVHNRNAWDGDMDKLVFFITPNNEDILKMSREIITLNHDSINASLTKFHQAKLIFEAIQKMGLHYLSDPNIPFYKDDRVQYAHETLEMGSGDCDDLVILFSSLLESLGIRTAFVEVRDSLKPIAHLYLMFDTGQNPKQAHLISKNEKRYIIRKNGFKKNSVWIPIETTLINQGFEDAWKAGALQYLQEGILRNGLAQGWVRIIDVE